MENEVKEKYLLAGKIAAEVREASKSLVKPDAKIIDIAENIERLVREKGAEPAFPVNISINDIGAHYSPSKSDDNIIKKDDVVKIDIGVHVDGYIGDTAYTIAFDKKHDKLIEASKAALEAVIKMCTPHEMLSDISEKIEEVIKGYGFNPISNLTGHGLDKYDLHAEPQIPNVKFVSDYKLKRGQVIAIEPFATNGAGMVKESDTILIFKFMQRNPVRSNDARAVMRFAEEINLPFAERWVPIGSVFKTRLAIRELRMGGVLYDYPVLKEAGGGLISQAEHTIIVDENPIVTTRL